MIEPTETDIKMIMLNMFRKLKDKTFRRELELPGYSRTGKYNSMKRFHSSFNTAEERNGRVENRSEENMQD